MRPTGLAEPVYDLAVEGEHEFYANDLLVHNCTWQPDSTESPGRIDASVHLAWALVPAVPARADATGAAALANVDLTSQIRPGQM